MRKKDIQIENMQRINIWKRNIKKVDILRENI